MTIKDIRVRTAAGAFKILESLTAQHVGFRGHRDATWRLGSTLARHHVMPLDWTTTLLIDDMIDHFIFQLKSIGISPPFDGNDRRGRLEYARHYGVPSPLIDFSHSPYVALFFAFNGVRPHQSKSKDHAAIYCLDFKRLANMWSDQNLTELLERNAENFKALANNFLFDAKQPFADGYPTDVLKYFGMPASWNHRMQRQLGVFLYDTLDYRSLRFNDLEAYLDQDEIGSSDRQVLTRILIPHKICGEIFKRLEIIGISATHLFGNPEGAASDVINGCHYNRRVGWAWDTMMQRD